MHRYLLTLIIAFMFATPAFACAFANIPLDSPLYEDIETLAACRLIESDLLSTRPFTRAEAGRLLAEAIRKGETMKIPSTVVKLLNRIAKEYKEEISEAKMEGTTPSTFLKPVDEFSINYGGKGFPLVGARIPRLPSHVEQCKAF
jgi:hypothetical protein